MTVLGIRMSSLMLSFWAAFVSGSLTCKYAVADDNVSYSEAIKLFQNGQTHESFRVFKSLIESETKIVSPFVMIDAAVVAAAAGEREEVFAWLEKAVDLGFVSREALVDEFDHYDRQQRLFADPRWAELLRQQHNEATRRQQEIEERSASVGDKPFRDLLDDLKSEETDLATVVDKIVSFSAFDQPSVTGSELLFFDDDAQFGKVPFLVYVPNSYDASKAWPLIVYLEGANGRFLHSMAIGLAGMHGSLFQDIKIRDDCLVLIPIADRNKGFAWSHSRPTIACLERLVAETKRRFNIDDSRVYAIGHSDGGRGAFGLATSNANAFAAMAGFNLAPVVDHRKTLLGNLGSRPFLWIHSGLDRINPIQDATTAAAELHAIGRPILFKSYPECEHSDRHIGEESEFAIDFLFSNGRNPNPSHLCWSSTANLDGRIDWLEVTKLSEEQSHAPWHEPLNFPYWDKSQQRSALASDWNNGQIYSIPHHGAVEASYLDNIFQLRTSQIGAVRILLSPTMVNFEEPVQVQVNGEILFRRRLEPSSDCLLKWFERTADRKALWTSEIAVDIPAEAVDGGKQASLDWIGERTEELRQAAHVPGIAVVVVRDGQCIYKRGFGLADLEQRAPMDAHSSLRLASATKFLSSLAILAQVVSSRWVAPQVARPSCERSRHRKKLAPKEVAPKEVPERSSGKKFRKEVPERSSGKKFRT